MKITNNKELAYEFGEFHHEWCNQYEEPRYLAIYSYIQSLVKQESKDRIIMCFNHYRFMIDQLVDDNSIESFIIAYGLDSDNCIKIAKEEGIELRQKDFKEVRV